MSAIEFPDHRRGVIINHITDTQQGYRPQFTDNWCGRIGDDLLGLAEFTDGHVHTGDCIEWNTPLPEDEKYIAFRASVLRTGKPYLDTPGNHDLSTYNTTPSRRYRSANEWAQEVPVRPVANGVMELPGGVAILGVSPDYWKYNDAGGTYFDPDPLTPQILGWLDSELTRLAGSRVWLASHALPATQLSDAPQADGSIADWGQIVALLDGHSNVAGWFSGHWHIDNADPRSIRSIPVGSRRIWGVNGPSSAGLFPGTTAAQHQWQRYAGSLFVTDMGDDIEVRWRNHLAQRWEAPFGESVKIYQH